jgi:hypothetical protein
MFYSLLSQQGRAGTTCVSVHLSNKLCVFELCFACVEHCSSVAHKVLASYDLQPLQQPGKRNLRA